MTAHFRRMCLIVSVLLLAAACGSGGAGGDATEDEGGSYGSGVNLDVGGKDAPTKDGDTKTSSGGTTSSGGSSGSGTTSGGGGSSGSGGSTAGDVGRAPQDFGGTGSMGVFYLRKDFPKMVIEINAAEGMEPGQASLNLLKARLESFVDKPGGIQILPTKTFQSSPRDYSMDEIRALEDRHRKRYSTRDVVVMHMLFLNGRPADSGAIGIAYRGSSLVVFNQAIRDAETPLVSAEDIEAAVVIHEAGHLFGLVNGNYESPRDHEDPEHEGHSKNRRSVMYWAVDNVGIATLLDGGEVPTDFDADDRADLADIKSGKIKTK